MSTTRAVLWSLAAFWIAGRIVKRLNADVDKSRWT